MDKHEPPEAIRAEEPAPEGAPARRPYEAPRVRSFPLFERMALGCDAGLKGSGFEDFS